MDKQYKYLVEFKIKVERTDNKILTNDENAMVEKMRIATNSAIAKIMADYGQNNRKSLEQNMVIY